MTAQDIGILMGYLVSAWALGFTGGFILTKYREAIYAST